MASNRHLARIAVVQALFAWEFRGGEPEEILAYVIEQHHPELESVEFAEQNLKGILAHREEIKATMVEHATEWAFDKIARLDRVILEQGIYELCWAPDVPPIVVINEAIEIAKAFGTDNAPKFINGVLSAVMKRPEAQRRVNQDEKEQKS